ncbi:nuclear transport factor 2 family protein [Isoptericola croceus]|uniref:nuclear transport factor 2 family protein n=1 Tax=Isoptericola croceus TaxID=3031406 RepID=UPI0023F8A4ED|nr:nuclear transport factor 2 family protein [Isoptericola croceus]
MTHAARTAQPQNPAEVVTALWERMEGRDWEGLAELLAPDVVVEWPVTGERFVGRGNVVAVNREYPEGWHIRVLRVIAAGEDVVSEVEVPQLGVGVFRAASFWTVRGGQVIAGTEYWTERGGDPAPAWRARFAQASTG